LDWTALTTAAIGAGKSAYVSGIQVWNGQTGVLTRNANANPAKIQSAQTEAIGKSVGGGLPITSVVPCAIP
jgi:hypothetical protein